MPVRAIYVLLALTTLGGCTATRSPSTAPAAGKAVPHFSRQAVAHNFGTPAGRRFLPEHAIDSEAVPIYSLGEHDSPDSPLPYYAIAPQTYLFFGNIAEVDENNRGWNGNAGFVVTDAGVVVIDALGSPRLGQRMLATIKSVTDKPVKYLIITHNHPDHAYGAIAFRNLPGVSILGHKGVLKYLDSDRIAHSVAYRRTFIEPDMRGFEAVTPDLLIDIPRYEKYTLQVGDNRFDIYNVGDQHSYGDLVVHQRNQDVLWVSDLVFNNRVTFMQDGHSKLALAGQEWLMRHFARVALMVPGHGSAQRAPFPMVRKTHDYISRLRNFMGQAIEAQVDLQDAVDRARFADWEAVNLYHLNQRPNANFIYREMEQELF